MWDDDTAITASSMMNRMFNISLSMLIVTWFCLILPEGWLRQPKDEYPLDPHSRLPLCRDRWGSSFSTEFVWRLPSIFHDGETNLYLFAGTILLLLVPFISTKMWNKVGAALMFRGEYYFSSYNEGCSVFSCSPLVWWREYHKLLPPGFQVSLPPWPRVSADILLLCSGK